MECADIRGGFVAGRIPAGPEVDAHLKWCPHCRELFEKGAELGRRLAQAVLPAAEPGDLFALIDRDVSREVGLRARLRALPTRVRAGALLALIGSMLGYQLVVHLRPNFATYSPLVFWGVVALLGTSAVAGVSRLLQGASAPLGAEARSRWFAVALLVAPAVATLLAPLGAPAPEAAGGWGSPSTCFSYGAALVAPFLLLYWLFERRDRVPLTVLVSAGGLAGITANLLLHAHCPSAHLGHLLLGHATIGVAWALALGLLSRPLQRAR